MKWDSDMMWGLYCVAMAVLVVRLNNIFWERLADLLNLIQVSYNLVLLILLVNTCFLVFHKAANQVPASTHVSAWPLYCLAIAIIIFHMPSMFWERFFDVLDLVQESYNLVLLVFLVNSCFLVFHRAANRVTANTTNPDATVKTSTTSPSSRSRSDSQKRDASSSTSPSWNELRLAWERSEAEKVVQNTILSKTVQDQATTIGQLTAIIHAHPFPQPSTPATDERTSYIAFLENSIKELNGNLAATQYELRAANEHKQVPAPAQQKSEEKIPVKSADVSNENELSKALIVARSEIEELSILLDEYRSEPLHRRLEKAEIARDVAKDRVRVLEDEIAQMQDAASAVTILSGEFAQPQEIAPAVTAHDGEFAQAQDPVTAVTATGEFAQTQEVAPAVTAYNGEIAQAQASMAAVTTSGEIAQLPEMVTAVTAAATPVDSQVELELEAARLANEQLRSEVASLQTRLVISIRENEQTMADKAVLQAHLESCVMERTQLELHNKESVLRVRDLESAGQSLQHQYTELDTQLQQTVQTGQILESEHGALKASHDAITCELVALQGRLESALSAPLAVQPADGATAPPLPPPAPVFTFGSNDNVDPKLVDQPAAAFDFSCIDWEAKHNSLEAKYNSLKAEHDKLQLDHNSLVDDTEEHEASMIANNKRIEDTKAEILQVKKHLDQALAGYKSCKRGRERDNKELQEQLASADEARVAASENCKQLTHQLEDVDMQLRNCEKNKKIVENRNMELEKKDSKTYKALQLQGLRLSNSTDGTLTAVIDTNKPHGLRYKIVPNARALAAELMKLGDELEEDLIKRPDDERYGRR